MKKLILFAACLAAFPAGAEELRFVTALSQPVASFARLESVNNKRPAEALFVNFCNTGVSAGSISAKGLVKMNEMRLTGGSRVGSSSGQMSYQIANSDGLTVASGGSLLGAKLLAKTANPRDITVGAGVKVNSAATFAAADLASLKIGANTTVVPSAHSKDYVMIWDDSYEANYKVSSDGVEALPGAVYNSYLLRYRVNDEQQGCPYTPFPLERQVLCKEELGEDYLGTIYKKWDSSTCSWKEVSRDCKKLFSCITKFEWKTAANSSRPTECGRSELTWHYSGYSSTAMVCGNATELSYCEPGQECDCEPGKVYLWRETYTCKAKNSTTGHEDIGACGYGYYCATCKKVASLSNCAPKPKNMGNLSCSLGGGVSQGEITKQPCVGEKDGILYDCKEEMQPGNSK